MSDEENQNSPTPPMCCLPHCEELAGSGSCEGNTPHALCDACFCGYAVSQFDVHGAFEQERTSTNDGIVSAKGELPCFRFLTNQCDCACLPAATLARVLSTDANALDSYEDAKRRIIQAQHDEEHAQAGAAQARREQEASPVDKLRDVVVDALSQGCYIPCPQCGKHGQKNDSCMHMTCPCGARYCYCCGRQRGQLVVNCRSNGSGCDSPSAYLENHPGWNEHRLSDKESVGMGALHEFHRRRMAYFLRQVKQHYPPDLWDSLRQEHPNLLAATPTMGRSIQWNEIDAAEPPLFGATTVEQLAWRDGGTQACAVAAALAVEHNGNPRKWPWCQGARESLPACETRKHFVVIWIVGFLIAIALLGLCAVSDSEALRIVGSTLMCLCVGAGLPMFAMMHVDYVADNPDHSLMQEVQCLGGRNNDPPYLSSEGRWSRFRALYFSVFFGGIALASLFFTIGNVPVLYAFGAFLLTEILLLYSGTTLLVNVMDLYRRPRLPLRIKMNVILGCISCTILSIGVGLLVGYHDVPNASVAGKVLLAIGVAGVVAEVVVFLVLQGEDESFLNNHPAVWHGVLLYCYIVCYGLAVGTLLLTLSRSDRMYWAGFIVIIVCAVICCAPFSERRD